MKRYLLQRHVHLYSSDHLAILMDLRNDAYIGLDQSQVDALRHLVAGWPPAERGAGEAAAESDAIAFADRLVGQKLLTLDTSQGKDGHPVALATVEAPLVPKYSEQDAGITIGNVATFLMACATAQFSLSCRSLERVVDRIERRKNRCWQAPTHGEHQLLHRLTVRFHYLRSCVYTAKDKCLFDSLVMIDFFAAYGIFPTWVIGVQPKPFAAHAWVQWDKFVLSGEPGFVRRFTPIVAV